MKLYFGDETNFLEFDINENDFSQGTVRGKVDFISFFKGVVFDDFKGFCEDLVKSYEVLDGQARLLDYVLERFDMKMTFDKMGYIDVDLKMCDDNEVNKVKLKFTIEQTFLNDFYREIKNLI